MHVESFGKPCDVNKRLVNLISKDTNLVFSIDSYPVLLQVESQ